jgi:hypothetical protein
LDFEIQRGGIERHFRVNKRLTRDDVLALFEAYFERGDLPDDVPLVTMEVW